MVHGCNLKERGMPKIAVSLKGATEPAVGFYQLNRNKQFAIFLHNYFFLILNFFEFLPLFQRNKLNQSIFNLSFSTGIVFFDGDGSQNPPNTHSSVFFRPLFCVWVGALGVRLAQSDELLHVDDAARVATEGIIRLTRREPNAMFQVQSVRNCNQEIELLDGLSWFDYSNKLYS